MSTLNVSNISDGTTTIPTTYVTNGSAKAWINFNGTGTIAARESLNVSSLTDNGTGIYTVNFTDSFDTADYGAVVGGRQLGTGVVVQGPVFLAPTTSAFRLASTTFAPVVIDAEYVFLVCHGDLA